MNGSIVKEQFNKQAKEFSRWSVTRNQEYHRRYVEFCGLAPEDDLLDVACGTGDFGIFCANRIRSVWGVDLSNGMLEIGKAHALKQGLGNIRFVQAEASNLPCTDESFSIIVCRSAFNHFTDHDSIFKEMFRCCRRKGRISIQDIVAFDDPQVNEYFEQLERQIDISHQNTLSEQFVTELFLRNDLDIVRSQKIEVRLHFKEYLSHAFQSEESLEKIHTLLDRGLKHHVLSSYFSTQNGEYFFMRNVVLLLGAKR